MRNLAHDRADGGDIEVAEIYLTVSSEVFVTDVASADDGDLIVSDEGLVVHPAIAPTKVGKRAEYPNGAPVQALSPQAPPNSAGFFIHRERLSGMTCDSYRA